MGKIHRRCRGCKWPFHAHIDSQYCDNCAQEWNQKLIQVSEAIDLLPDPTPESIAEASGLDLAEVERVLERSPSLAFVVRRSAQCKQCRRELAEHGRLCLTCRLDLHAELEAQKAVVGLAPPPIQALHSHVLSGAMQRHLDLQEKRDQTGHNRFDPAPAHRKRYG